MANEEKVIVTKSKITNLADKVRAKAGTSINYTFDSMAAAIENLQTGVNEETLYTNLNEMTFGAGYTLTLMQSTKTDYTGVVTSDEYAEYSLDNGNTWTKFYGLSLPLVLENVSTISFRVAGGDGSSGAFIVGNTSTSSDVATLMAQQQPTTITITENKTLYIGSYTGIHSGGAGN